MREDVKPCPFCGSDDIEVRIGTRDREGLPIAWTCTDCGANGPWVYAPDDQVGAYAATIEWNARAKQQEAKGRG